MSEVKEKVEAYILENTFEDKSKIKVDTMIFKEGFFDSMGFALLLGFLEEAFGIVPDDADLVEENFESINAITEFVAKKAA
ncbi:acyl carrier protein [Bacteroidales bacterium]|nr:acyl carrier protein [Bacteroidales bacterium]